MIDDHFTLWVESQTGINWLASKALPELGTALPQLVLSFLALGLPMIGWPSSNFGLRFAKKHAWDELFICTLLTLTPS